MKTKLFTILLFLLTITSIQSAELPEGLITLDGSLAKDFSLTDYDDKKYSLATSRGRWVLLHFWASWCGPCRREMPIIYQLQKQLKDYPVDIILVNTAEDEDTIFSFLGSVAPDLQSYMDRDGDLTESWSPRGLPTTFFIDPQGRKRYLALGGRPWNEPAYQAFVLSLFK